MHRANENIYVYTDGDDDEESSNEVLSPLTTADIPQTFNGTATTDRDREASPDIPTNSSLVNDDNKFEDDSSETTQWLNDDNMTADTGSGSLLTDLFRTTTSGLMENQTILQWPMFSQAIEPPFAVNNATCYNDTLVTSSVANVELSIAELYAIYRPSIALVDQYVTPIWYAVGFPGNLLSFAVWTRPRMRPSSGCYLAALAAGDFLFLLLHLVFELQAAWGLPTLQAAFVCEVFPVFFLALQHLSPLLVLAFTVERYISVCHPFQREKYCTTRRAKTVIGLLSLGVATLNSVQAYFWRYDADIGDCGVRQEVTSNGIRSVWSIWSWITELMAFGLVPVAIFVLNSLVIAETRRMSANEAKLMGHCRPIVGSPAASGGRVSVSGPSATTVMLMAVSFYLIATTLPVTVVYAIYFSFPTGNSLANVTSDVTWQRHLTYWTVRTVVQEVGMSHYAGNFLIYVATGKIFRSELGRLLGARCNRRRRKTTMAVATMDRGTVGYRRHRGNSNGYIASSTFM